MKDPQGVPLLVFIQRPAWGPCELRVVRGGAGQPLTDVASSTDPYISIGGQLEAKWNRQGEMEILVSRISSGAPKLYVLQGGTLKERSLGNLLQSVCGPASLGDANLDGTLDILIGGLLLLRGPNGKVLAQRRYQSGCSWGRGALFPFQIADVDRDGVPELVGWSAIHWRDDSK